MNDRFTVRTGLLTAKGLRIAAMTGAGCALLAASSLLSGCGSKDTFARVNGQTVTKDEYIKQLEKQTVTVQGGPPTNAERVVLDTIIGNRVILAEAAKANCLPTDEDVNHYYDLQKRLFEQEVPGKNYEQTMQEQGVSPDTQKSDMRVLLAETNLYAKELKLGDDQVRKAYENAHGQVGLPARAQFRLIVVQPGSPDFTKAGQALAAPNADFDAVAKQINLTPLLRSTGGLQLQATPLKNIGASFQSKVEQTPEGKWFGPVDYVVDQRLPKMKAWIKVEKKLPGYTVSYDDAAPMVRRQLVQMEIMQPQNAGIRSTIVQEKLKASFEPSDARYGTVWDAVKKSATDAGLGQSQGMATGLQAAPAAVTAPGAPAAAAPAKK